MFVALGRRNGLGWWYELGMIICISTGTQFILCVTLLMRELFINESIKRKARGAFGNVRSVF